MDKYLIRLPKPNEIPENDATMRKVTRTQLDVSSDDEKCNKENKMKINTVDVENKLKDKGAAASVAMDVKYTIHDEDEEDDNHNDRNAMHVLSQKSKRKGNSTKQVDSKAKKNKVGGLTLEQHRRKMGDAVKSRLSMEKYCMKADCHATVDIPIEVFKQLVVPHASTLTPETFTISTPVVVALIKGREAAGEVFGKSKIRGGNKYEQCEMEKCDIVFFPAAGKARLWWIMYRRWMEEDLSD